MSVQAVTTLPGWTCHDDETYLAMTTSRHGPASFRPTHQHLPALPTFHRDTLPSSARSRLTDQAVTHALPDVTSLPCSLRQAFTYYGMPPAALTYRNTSVLLVMTKHTSHSLC